VYSEPTGSATVRREGKDVAIVSTSYRTAQSVKAVEASEKRGIDPELIDLRSIKPWDRELVFVSVYKTGRLIVTDAAWSTCGVAAEIAATVACEMFERLTAPIVRVTLPDAPAPMSAPLETMYYIGADNIVAAVEKLFP
jgi:acetoin:2,6-dichlorophenolindophenol oxidoreductase subunit beta